MSTKVKPFKRGARSKRKKRMTVQLSSYFVGAIEARASEEAIPVAIFIRRAVTRLVNDTQRTGELVRREVTDFEEAQRRGQRGPMRQWPESVSYVADPHIADGLKALAEEHGVDASVLAREALVRDLDRPGTVGRAQPKDEIGFTTSGAPPRGRESQHVMNEAWRSTNT